MSDRLTLTRALENGGMQRDAAERIATEIYDAIHDNTATKTDIAAVRSDLREAIAAVRSDLSVMEQRTAVRFEQVERRIDGMVIRLGALVVVVTGLLFVALQHWPPHS